MARPGGPARGSFTVPATSANLGPGFDALGMALSLSNRVSWRLAAEPGLETIGPEAGDHPAGPGNLTLRALETAFRRAGRPVPGVAIRVQARIPVGRGLGSSAAAIVAGVALAGRLLGPSCSLDDAVELATGIEGHPDNVVPALVGGIVASARVGERVVHRALPLRRCPRVLLWVPEIMLSTAEARRVLPDQVPRADAIHNVSRVALLVAGLVTGDGACIGAGLSDRLHQPYRAPLVPDLDRALACARSWGALGAYLSGAGPSIAFLVDGDPGPIGARIRTELSPAPGRLMELTVPRRGAWA